MLLCDSFCGTLCGSFFRARVGLGATARCGGFEESARTRLTQGLGGGGADCLGELAGRTLGVGGAHIWTIW